MVCQCGCGGTTNLDRRGEPRRFLVGHSGHKWLAGEAPVNKPWPAKTAEELWALFDKHGPIHPTLGTRCWLWTKGTNSDGYGEVWWRRRKQKTHRIAWTLTYGPPTKLICHHCDVRRCGRPEHLFEGTYDDNMADMVAKGRKQASSGSFKAGPDQRRCRNKLTRRAN